MIISPFIFNADAGDLEHKLFIAPTRTGMSVHGSLLHGKSNDSFQSALRVGGKKNDGTNAQRPQPYYRQFGSKY